MVTSLLVLVGFLLLVASRHLRRVSRRRAIRARLFRVCGRTAA